MQIDDRMKKIKEHGSQEAEKYSPTRRNKQFAKKRKSVENTPIVNTPMEVIDGIYLGEQSEVWAHLDDIQGDIEGWCERKEEPPNFMLSVIDKITQYKRIRERKQ